MGRPIVIPSHSLALYPPALIRDAEHFSPLSLSLSLCLSVSLSVSLYGDSVTAQRWALAAAAAFPQGDSAPPS